MVKKIEDITASSQTGAIPQSAIEEALQRKVSQNASRLSNTPKIDPSITGAVPVIVEHEDMSAPRDVDAATQ